MAKKATSLALSALATLAAAALLAAISGEAKAAPATHGAPAAAKLSCSDAVSALIPCESYLLGSGGNLPTKECCRSAQALNREVATKPDREALCECFVKMGPSFGVKPELARQLPVYCKIQLKISISTAANCSQF